MLMGGELFNAPIKSPQKVLDLGTGTGIWAIDFAEYTIQSCLISSTKDIIDPSLAVLFPKHTW